MTFLETPLAGAYLITISPRGDSRGWFARTYCEREFSQIGHHAPWVQMNHSMTRQLGAIRGMHFQYQPHAEIKLVRCVAGRVFDVLVDLRAGSPTLGQWFGAELSAENGQMMYVPKGFAHGFQTLATDCQLLYCHSNFYEPQREGAVRFDDPKIGVQWPLPVTDISARDASHPLLDDPFVGITI